MQIQSRRNLTSLTSNFVMLYGALKTHFQISHHSIKLIEKESMESLNTAKGIKTALFVFLLWGIQIIGIVTQN